MSAFRIAIVGYGKIAGDEHRPAIDRNGDFELAALLGATHVRVGTGFFGAREMG